MAAACPQSPFVPTMLLPQDRASLTPSVAACARVAAGLAAALLLSACAPRYQPMGEARQPPQLADAALIAADGYRLTLRAWLPARPGDIDAVVVALHGLNDHSLAWDRPARHWAERGVATYAYDQRGFGANAEPGIWPGAETLMADLDGAVDAVAERHPGKPILLVGESMGGAVVLAALARPASANGGPALAGKIRGAVLSAPALWGADSMNLVYRATLWVSSRVAPGMRVQPPANLRITASDNLAMLRSLGSDPRVLKRTRMDTLAGMVSLMSLAEARMDQLPATLPLLVLYGQNEEVLPRPSVTQVLERWDGVMPGRAIQLAIYEQGYHMLMRDICAPAVWHDVGQWLRQPGAAPDYGLGRSAWLADKPRSPGPVAQVERVDCPVGIAPLQWGDVPLRAQQQEANGAQVQHDLPAQRDTDAQRGAPTQAARAR